MKRLLSYSDGIKTFISGNFDDGIVLDYEFDECSATLEASKELAKTDDHWNEGVKKSIVHYAHIPDSILFKWHVENGIPLHDTKALFKMVNQPEWSYLKTTRKIHV